MKFGLFNFLLIFSFITIAVSSNQSLKLNNFYNYPNVNNLDTIAVDIVDYFSGFERPLPEDVDETKLYKNQLLRSLNTALRRIDIYKNVPNKWKYNLTDHQKILIEEIKNRIFHLNNQLADNSIDKNELKQNIEEWVQSKLDSEGHSASQFLYLEAYVSFIVSVLEKFSFDVYHFHHQYAFDPNLDDDEFNNKTSVLLDGVKKNINNYHEILKIMVTCANKKIENNDPNEFERDVNFIELERLFQPFVVNSRRLGGHKQCRTIKNYLWEISKSTDEILCQGYASDCFFVGSSAHCTGKQNQYRRIEWITFSESNFPKNFDISQINNYKENESGNIDACIKPLNFTIQNQESTWSYNENCVCTCTENTFLSHKSTFIISSQIEHSDIHKNKIIVGVKFVKINKIIYTQIEQAELLPGGWINNNTVNWKKISLLDKEKIKKNLVNNKTDYKKYIVIGNDIKKFNLNDLHCNNKSHLVTGVGLKLQETKNNENHIILVIKCNKINFDNGKIDKNDSYYLQNTENHLLKKKIGEMPPNKVNEKNKSNDDKINNYYIELQTSSIKRDFGQSVIPWFDGQSVTLNEERSPLNGVGLYHRGSNDSGGFLAYRLFTLDHSILI